MSSDSLASRFAASQLVSTGGTDGFGGASECQTCGTKSGRTRLFAPRYLSGRRFAQSPGEGAIPGEAREAEGYSRITGRRALSEADSNGRRARLKRIESLSAILEQFAESLDTHLWAELARH